MNLYKNTIILIPVYNEGKKIGSVIRNVINEGWKNVIVIDDGSTDDTSSVAKSEGAYVIRHLLNRGKGASIKTGLEVVSKLQADVVVTIDGDGQHNPKDIAKLVKYIHSGYDVVLGIRNYKLIPWYKAVFNILGNIATWVMFSLFVKDSQSGFRAYNSHALNVIKTNNDRYEYDTEVIREIAIHNLKWLEVSIDVNYTSYDQQKRNKQSVYNAMKTFIKLLFFD